MENTNPQTPIVPQFRIDEQIMKANLEKYKMQQNLGLGIIGGVIGGVIGTAAWAADYLLFSTSYWLDRHHCGFYGGIWCQNAGQGNR